MNCTCGNELFSASQDVTENIIMSGNGLYIDTINIVCNKEPNGPFKCTKCGKIYTSIKDKKSVEPFGKRITRKF
jgi:hypothetical protein